MEYPHQGIGTTKFGYREKTTNYIEDRNQVKRVLTELDEAI
jgi:hypothetical protein